MHLVTSARQRRFKGRLDPTGSRVACFVRLEFGRELIEEHRHLSNLTVVPSDVSRCSTAPRESPMRSAARPRDKGSWQSEISATIAGIGAAVRPQLYRPIGCSRLCWAGGTGQLQDEHFARVGEDHARLTATLLEDGFDAVPTCRAAEWSFWKRINRFWILRRAGRAGLSNSAAEACRARHTRLRLPVLSKGHRRSLVLGNRC